jgi:predicted ArsR family transcriptional regulator
MQIEKATGETIFIGYRTVSNLIRDQYGHMIDPMTVFRRTQDLISEGMLEIVVKGEKGNFGRPANGYRFLNWKAQEEITKGSNTQGIFKFAL